MHEPGENQSHSNKRGNFPDQQPMLHEGMPPVIRAWKNPSDIAMAVK
jgi:hypothetical protein